MQPVAAVAVKPGRLRLGAPCRRVRRSRATLSLVPAPIEPSRVLTLTTDLGHKGPYVASMKGVILSRFAQAVIVDLSHENHPHWPPEAGFWLARTFRDFPPGTVHVAVVDPGVGTGRDVIAAECDDHLFVGPDNGLLFSLFERAKSVRCHRYDPARRERFGWPAPSATFHGRDIFAPLAADLAAGRLRVGDVGSAVDVDALAPAWIDPPTRTSTELRGVVMTTDQFGNVITNIDADMLATFDTPVVRVAGHDVPVRRTYGDARPGEYVALLNAFGVLEIARAESSASTGLGIERGAAVVVHEPRAST